MYAVIKPERKHINHPDKRTRLGIRTETVTWYSVIDEETGKELNPGQPNKQYAQQWAFGFNKAVNLMKWAGTWRE